MLHRRLEDLPPRRSLTDAFASAVNAGERPACGPPRSDAITYHTPECQLIQIAAAATLRCRMSGYRPLRHSRSSDLKLFC